MVCVRRQSCKLFFVALACQFYTGGSCSTAKFQTCPTDWYARQSTHKHVDLLKNKSTVEYLAFELASNESEFQDVLDSILYPRSVGSEGNIKARKYIKDTLKDMGWTIRTDPFEQDTVVGMTAFENIMAQWNPSSPRQLIFACHYDTCRKPEGFVGAIDSAVPCSMIIDLMKNLNPLLKKKSEETGKCNDLSPTLVFFDGEEALQRWSFTDGIYGSRHLAGLWKNTSYIAPEQFPQLEPRSELDRIDLFVLLDLIGTPAPKFQSYYFDENEFNPHYEIMKEIEQMLATISPVDLEIMFTDRSSGYPVTDDQTPFVKAGLTSILHLITRPFPSVWHTINDNKSALDFEYIERLNMILRIFTAQYLQLLPS